MCSVFIIKHLQNIFIFISQLDLYPPIFLLLQKILLQQMELKSVK